MSNRNRTPRPHETPKLKRKPRRRAESDQITKSRRAFLALHRSGITSDKAIRALSRKTLVFQEQRKEREL